MTKKICISAVIDNILETSFQKKKSRYIDIGEFSNVKEQNILNVRLMNMRWSEEFSFWRYEKKTLISAVR